MDDMGLSLEHSLCLTGRPLIHIIPHLLLGAPFASHLQACKGHGERGVARSTQSERDVVTTPIHALAWRVMRGVAVAAAATVVSHTRHSRRLMHTHNEVAAHHHPSSECTLEAPLSARLLLQQLLLASSVVQAAAAAHSWHKTQQSTPHDKTQAPPVLRITHQGAWCCCCCGTPAAAWSWKRAQRDAMGGMSATQEQYG